MPHDDTTDRLLTVAQAAEILATGERYPGGSSRNGASGSSGSAARPHPRIRTARVHRGRARRAGHRGPESPEGRSDGRETPVRRVRQLPSGRWQARYKGPDGSTGLLRDLPTKTDAERWLALTEAEILTATGSTPTPAWSPSPSTRKPGWRSGPTCGLRRSSSTAAWSACTWPPRWAPSHQDITRAARAPLAQGPARRRGRPGHRSQGIPAAQSHHEHRRR